MFYITAHTVTQNQFANIVSEHQLPDPDPFSVCIGPYGLATINEKKPSIVLLPYTIEKLPEKNGDLNQILVVDGLRAHTTSVCSTKSLLSDTGSERAIWGGETILVIMMAVIFALLLLTLITLVFIKIIG